MIKSILMSTGDEQPRCQLVQARGDTGWVPRPARDSEAFESYSCRGRHRGVWPGAKLQVEVRIMDYDKSQPTKAECLPLLTSQ